MLKTAENWASFSGICQFWQFFFIPYALYPSLWVSQTVQLCAKKKCQIFCTVSCFYGFVLELLLWYVIMFWLHCCFDWWQEVDLTLFPVHTVWWWITHCSKKVRLQPLTHFSHFCRSSLVCHRASQWNIHHLKGSRFCTHRNSKKNSFRQTVGGGSLVWMSSIVCLCKSFLLSLQTSSSLLTAALSVAPSGPHLKTIKICWNFLFTVSSQFEGKYISFLSAFFS